MRGAQKGRELGGEKERGIGNKLRANVSKQQTIANSGMSPKICFNPYFHIL